VELGDSANIAKSGVIIFLIMALNLQIFKRSYKWENLQI